MNALALIISSLSFRSRLSWGESSILPVIIDSLLDRAINIIAEKEEINETRPEKESKTGNRDYHECTM